MGASARQPRDGRVLLIVQQGPGLPLICDARVFERRLRLEKDAVVAYWDQRGTGKSFRADPQRSVSRRAWRTCARGGRAMHAARGSIASTSSVSPRRNVGRDGGGAGPGAHRAPGRGRPRRRVERERAVGLRFRTSRRRPGAEPGGPCGSSRPSARRRTTPRRSFMTRVRWVTAYRGINRRRGYFGLLWDTASRVLRAPHYALARTPADPRRHRPTQERMLAPVNDFDLRTAVTRIEVPIASSRAGTTSGPTPRGWPATPRPWRPLPAGRSSGSRTARTCPIRGACPFPGGPAARDCDAPVGNRSARGQGGPGESWPAGMVVNSPLLSGSDHCKRTPFATVGCWASLV